MSSRRIARLLAAATAMTLGGAVSACGGGTGARPQTVAELNRVRESPGAKLAAERAPQAFAVAEQRRAAALAAEKGGDNVAAELLAERAIAGYTRALVLARRAEAQRELDDASAVSAKNEGQLRELSAGRATAEREAEELEKRLKIARELLLPPPSGPVPPEREAARLVAARAMVTQGRLLCGSARLLSPSLEGLSSAEGAVARLETQLEGKPRSASISIDSAARARATCLDVLTKARRSAKDAVTGLADALLTELSTASWAPARDERGVVVMLHGAFQGSALTADAKRKLEELGRVAAAHPTFGVQLVSHDATPGDAAASLARAESAAGVLVAAGAAKERVSAESAGVRAPLVDPQDAGRRARNARLEIVFVTPGN